jgi:putative ABC transport system permease protein
MNLWQRIREDCRALFGKAKLDREMDEEMRAHIEMRTQANIVAGMSPEEARHAALRSFGGMEQIKEVCRDLRGVGWIETFLQDVRFGLRMLRRSPAFTGVAVLSLGLGITLSCAVFSYVDGIWLRSMPFEDPAKLVRIFAGDSAAPRAGLPFPDYQDLAAQMRSVSGLAFNNPREVVLTGSRATGAEGREDLRADLVSRNFFSVLGIRPFLGRFFSEADAADLRNVRGVVLSYRLWQRRFGGETNVVGQAIELEGGGGASVVVLGIAPPEFCGLERLYHAEVWYPWESWEGGLRMRSRHGPSLTVIARLKQGCTARQVQVEAEAVFRRLDLREVDSGAPLHAAVVTEAHLQFEQTGSRSLLLLGIVGTVLLLACANVSSLLLARAEARPREMGVRVALGAGRRRLIRQLLTESLVLALVVGGVSLVLAKWMIAAVPALFPADMVRFDGRVVAFGLVLSVLTVFMFGLAPALRVSRQAVCPALKGEPSLGFKGRSRTVLSGLVVGQTCGALVLVSLAALLARSLMACYATDLGFERKPVLVSFVNLANTEFKEEAGRLAFSQLKERLLALPGVKRVSVAGAIPFWTGDLGAVRLLPTEGGSSAAQAGRAVKFNIVDGDYFALLGIRVLRGRGLTEHDDLASPRVMVINETMAKSFWPGEDPVGRSLWLEGPTNQPVRIVGVVHNTKLGGIEEEPEPYLYLPFGQRYYWKPFVLIESKDVAALASPVRSELRAVGSRTDPISMKALIDVTLGTKRFLAQVSVAVGLVGLVLASVGLYGVLSYTVRRRTREIGVRMALGAQRRDVLLMILREGLSLAVLGVVLAAPVLLALSHVVRAFLYGVSPLDPLSLGAAALVLLAVAVLAAYLPARRAMSTDPMAALRYE